MPLRFLTLSGPRSATSDSTTPGQRPGARPSTPSSVRTGAVPRGWSRARGGLSGEPLVRDRASSWLRCTRPVRLCSLRPLKSRPMAPCAADRVLDRAGRPQHSPTLTLRCGLPCALRDRSGGPGKNSGQSGGPSHTSAPQQRLRPENAPVERLS